jgi:hypothetical protein
MPRFPVRADVGELFLRRADSISGNTSRDKGSSGTGAAWQWFFDNSVAVRVAKSQDLGVLGRESGTL